MRGRGTCEASRGRPSPAAREAALADQTEAAAAEDYDCGSLDDTPLDPSQLNIPDHQGSLVVETAGGLMVPLTRNWLQIDQLVKWQLPIVLVARSGLGTLNHTLLSLEAMRRRNLTVLGLILNGPLHADNPGTLEQFGDVPVLAQLPPQASLSATVLERLWREKDLTTTFRKVLKRSSP